MLIQVQISQSKTMPLATWKQATYLLPWQTSIFKFVCRVSSPFETAPFETGDSTDYSGLIVEVKASGTDDMGFVINMLIGILWWLYIYIHRCCFLPWHKTHQKGFNVAKELGCALFERWLMSKLKSSQLTDIFWNKLEKWVSFISMYTYN